MKNKRVALQEMTRSRVVTRLYIAIDLGQGKLGEAESVCREMIAVLHAPPLWMGYSPQHMYAPGSGRGTITVRSSTLLNLIHDVARSLIHHGFNRIIFINGHGSNVKVIDPVLRKLRYETGALIGFVKPYMENYVGILKGLMENPPDETPGWHSSASQMRSSASRFNRTTSPLAIGTATS